MAMENLICQYISGPGGQATLISQVHRLAERRIGNQVVMSV